MIEVAVVVIVIVVVVVLVAIPKQWYYSGISIKRTPLQDGLHDKERIALLCG